MLHPHEMQLMELLKQRNVSMPTLRGACGCSGQRAKALLLGRVAMTMREYAALTVLAGLRLPAPDEMGVLSNVANTKQSLANVYEVRRKRSYKPVVEDADIMLAIMQARESIMQTMPTLVADGTLTGESWCESAAAALWSAAGGQPASALATFCARMSLAVLARAMKSMRLIDRKAIVRYLVRHEDALATPYDFVVRFAPQRVERSAAVDVYNQWLEAARTETVND